MPAKKNSRETALLEKMADSRISFNMTPREILEFVLRLASDDDFRSRLENNPHEVLAENHIHIPVPDVPLHVNLPNKDELQRAVIDIMAGHHIKLTALPFNVDPGYWFFIDFLIFLARTPSKPCKWTKPSR
jgi:hypothetical protein